MKFVIALMQSLIEPSPVALEHERSTTVHAQPPVESSERVSEIGRGTDDVARVEVPEKVVLPNRISVALEERKDETVKPPSKLELLDAPGLLKYGISVGVAAAFITTVGGSSNSHTPSQRDLGVSAMPYLAIVPAYWHLGDVTREYCAARRLLVGKDEALRRADETADYVAYLRAQQINPEDVRTLSKGDLAKKYVQWKRGVPGRCFTPWSMLGVYAGIPLAYNASFRFSEADQEIRKTLDVKPRISFGLAIVPIAYVNVLVGVSLISVQIPERNFASRWHLTVGIGGTLDIFARLLK